MPLTVVAQILPGRRVVVRPTLGAIGSISARYHGADDCLITAEPAAADVHRTATAEPDGEGRGCKLLTPMTGPSPLFQLTCASMSSHPPLLKWSRPLRHVRNLSGGTYRPPDQTTRSSIVRALRADRASQP